MASQMTIHTFAWTTESYPVGQGRNTAGIHKSSKCTGSLIFHPVLRVWSDLIASFWHLLNDLIV